ncbi:hypothetical protein C2E23DRAFT_848324 [Lenzites betulinus]|nr:hypothetical protein C2E23DRAFT_848324 [Lenzites betulinus]
MLRLIGRHLRTLSTPCSMPPLLNPLRVPQSQSPSPALCLFLSTPITTPPGTPLFNTIENTSITTGRQSAAGHLLSASVSASVLSIGSGRVADLRRRPWQSTYAWRRARAPAEAVAAARARPRARRTVFRR